MTAVHKGVTCAEGLQLIVRVFAENCGKP